MTIRRESITPITAGAFLLFSIVPIGNKGVPPFAAPIRVLSQASLATLAQGVQVGPGQLHERLMTAGLQPKSDQQSPSDLVGPDMRKQAQILGTLFAAAK